MWPPNLLKGDYKRALKKGESQCSTEEWIGNFAAGACSGSKHQMLLEGRINL